MTTAELISVIKDVVTIITLVLGAGITVYGVNTWRKQLIAKAEFDLAKRLLVAIYKVRQAYFDSIRFIYIENNSETINTIAEKKFSLLENAYSSLDVELLEAMATWGEDRTFNKYSVLLTTLRVEFYQAKTGREYKIPFNTYLFTKKDPDFKEFHEYVNKLVENFEEFLRPKMKLHI